MYPDFGRDMLMDVTQMVVCGSQRITREEALRIVAEHSGSNCLIYTHGLGTTIYYACIMATVYARDLKQRLVLLVTWPSNPGAATVAGGW